MEFYVKIRKICHLCSSVKVFRSLERIQSDSLKVKDFDKFLTLFQCVVKNVDELNKCTAECDYDVPCIKNCYGNFEEGDKRCPCGTGVRSVTVPFRGVRGLAPWVRVRVR